MAMALWGRFLPAVGMSDSGWGLHMTEPIDPEKAPAPLCASPSGAPPGPRGAPMLLPRCGMGSLGRGSVVGCPPRRMWVSRPAYSPQGKPRRTHRAQRFTNAAADLSDSGLEAEAAASPSAAGGSELSPAAAAAVSVAAVSVVAAEVSSGTGIRLGGAFLSSSSVGGTHLVLDLEHCAHTLRLDGLGREEARARALPAAPGAAFWPEGWPCILLPMPIKGPWRGGRSGREKSSCCIQASGGWPGPIIEAPGGCPCPAKACSAIEAPRCPHGGAPR
mmetsp:Transcript_33374/g.75403  ORF Transcript_33374/g.75403 Transcript_33374/m.75403 type:complete len:275 (+) Transcript_33374:598-1422(+)